MKQDNDEKDNDELTDRELEIMLLIADGLTNSMIAEKLSISKNTAHNHRVSIFRKLHANNVATMIKAAKEKGLIK